MSVRRIVVQGVPLSHDATVVTHQDRLRASLQSLPKPKATEAYARQRKVGAYRHWPGGKVKADSFLLAYNAKIEGLMSTRQLTQSNAERYKDIIRDAYLKPGFVEMLGLAQEANDDKIKWAKDLFEQKELDAMQEAKKRNVTFFKHSASAKDAYVNTLIAAMYMVSREMLDSLKIEYQL